MEPFPTPIDHQLPPPSQKLFWWLLGGLLFLGALTVALAMTLGLAWAAMLVFVGLVIIVFAAVHHRHDHHHHQWIILIALIATALLFSTWLSQWLHNH
jgi:O-antigen/teichoic acid export membrane protein